MDVDIVRAHCQNGRPRPCFGAKQKPEGGDPPRYLRKNQSYNLYHGHFLVFYLRTRLFLLVARCFWSHRKRPVLQVRWACTASGCVAPHLCSMDSAFFLGVVLVTCPTQELFRRKIQQLHLVRFCQSPCQSSIIANASCHAPNASSINVLQVQVSPDRCGQVSERIRTKAPMSVSEFFLPSVHAVLRLGAAFLCHLLLISKCQFEYTRRFAMGSSAVCHGFFRVGSMRLLIFMCDRSSSVFFWRRGPRLQQIIGPLQIENERWSSSCLEVLQPSFAVFLWSAGFVFRVLPPLWYCMFGRPKKSIVSWTWKRVGDGLSWKQNFHATKKTLAQTFCCIQSKVCVRGVSEGVGVCRKVLECLGVCQGVSECLRMCRGVRRRCVGGPSGPRTPDYRISALGGHCGVVWNLKTPKLAVLSRVVEFLAPWLSEMLVAVGFWPGAVGRKNLCFQTSHTRTARLIWRNSLMMDRGKALPRNICFQMCFYVPLLLQQDQQTRIMKTRERYNGTLVPTHVSSGHRDVE